jgi:hypothetical protein
MSQAQASVKPSFLQVIENKENKKLGFQVCRSGCRLDKDKQGAISQACDRRQQQNADLELTSPSRVWALESSDGLSPVCSCRAHAFLSKLVVSMFMMRFY